jgi:hypothetical protein
MPFPGISDFRSCEEVYPDGFELRTVPLRRENSDSKSLVLEAELR